MLYRARVESRADFVDLRPACGTIAAQHPDLDELVAFQRDVDLLENRRRETRLSDHDHRMEMVRTRAQRAPLGWREDTHNVEF